MTVRVLHLDKEGGYGGSSRSLFELVSRLDRSKVEPVVAYRTQGPASEWYSRIGVETVHIPTLGSYVPRQTRYWRNLAASMPQLLASIYAVETIKKYVDKNRIDVIHVNYEGLIWSSILLRARINCPFIVHIRAHWPVNRPARWLAKAVRRVSSHVFCISPQELERYIELGGYPENAEVLWNPARAAKPRRSFDEPPRIVYFGSIDRSKGTDRLVDLAAALDRAGAPPLLIDVYGEARTHPDVLEYMERRISAEGLADRIVLRGFHDDPQDVLASAFAAIRPSRWNDPWGRDVIEAQIAGVPTIATGTYGGVILNEKTGWLIGEFDADLLAKRLMSIAVDPDLWRQMSAAGSAHAAERFGPSSSDRFEAVVQSLAQRGGA